MATSSFYFSFGMGQRLAAESAEAEHEVDNMPKMGKKSCHVIYEVNAIGLVQVFSREKGRDFLKSKSVSRESDRVNSDNTSGLGLPYQVYLVSPKDIAP